MALSPIKPSRCKSLLPLKFVYYFLHLQRNAGRSEAEDKTSLNAMNNSSDDNESINRKEPTKSQSNLVFGYLNLFSDGVVCPSFYPFPCLDYYYYYYYF